MEIYGFYFIFCKYIAIKLVIFLTPLKTKPTDRMGAFHTRFVGQLNKLGYFIQFLSLTVRYLNTSHNTNFIYL